jgi:hypothetical protein
MLTQEQIHTLAVAITGLPDSLFSLVNVERIIAEYCNYESHEGNFMQQALIQILAGQRQISRKLDELLNPNRQSRSEHCHQEVITMKGVFTVTFRVEPGSPPPLEVESPEDLGSVGGLLQVPALEIAGGTPPYTVALDPSSGPLPPGVSMDASGNLTGAPTEAGSFDVVVDVTDSLEAPGSQPGSASAPGTSATGKSTIAASGAAVHGQYT